MRTLVAIPCMDMVHSVFLKSMLGLQHEGDIQYAISCSSLVYDSRNVLAKQAVDEGYDRILWLDSDMDFAPDLLKRLSKDMDEGREYVSGIFFKRKAPVLPCIYKECGYFHKSEKEIVPVADPYLDYPRDQVFEVAATGLAAVLMTTDLVKRVRDKFGLPFSPMVGFGEDITFCARATQLGAKLYCDSRVKVGHVGLGTITEDTYIEGRGK